MKYEMNSNIKIRELSILDLFRIRKLSEAYFNAFDSYTDAISSLRILYYFLNKKNIYFFIAEVRGNIIGIAYAHTYPHRDLVYLDFIAVSKSFQRKGIGTILLKTILLRAIKANKKKVFFIIRADNDAGIKFYEKHGFKRVKIYYGYELNL